MSLRDAKHQLLSLADNLEALAAEVGQTETVKTAASTNFSFDFGSVSQKIASGGSAEQNFIAGILGS